MTNNGTKKTVITLFIVTVLMFGFGYAMVPLYDVFCKITGLNGKTIRVVESEVKEEYKTDRIVKIRFDSNINGDLPWKLKSNVKTMKVHPGKFYEATYVVENLCLDPVLISMSTSANRPEHNCLRNWFI